MCEEAETIAINVKSTENKTQKKVQSVSDLLKAKLTSSNIPTSDQTVSNPSTTNQDATSTCENDHPVSRSISQSGLNSNQQTVTHSQDSDKKTVIIDDSIIKGVQKRGLTPNVDVYTLPGARVRDVFLKVKSNDMSNWERCFLYVGVNDAADQCVLKSCYDEIWVMINYIRTRSACIRLVFAALVLEPTLM